MYEKAQKVCLEFKIINLLNKATSDPMGRFIDECNLDMPSLYYRHACA